MLSKVDLPHPEWPIMRDELALLDAQVHVAQHFRRHLAAAEAHADLFELEVGLGGHGLCSYCAEAPCETK